MITTELNKLWARLVAKAWADEAYQEKLIKNPREALHDEGVEFAEHVNIHIVTEPKESTNSDVYFYFPQSFESYIENGEDKKVGWWVVV